jgi:hypothetical protein
MYRGAVMYVLDALFAGGARSKLLPPFKDPTQVFFSNFSHHGGGILLQQQMHQHT